MENIIVKAPLGSYFVNIGSNMDIEELVKPSCNGKKVLIISDDNVYPIYGAEIRNIFKHCRISVTTHVVTAGEASKTLENVSVIYNILAKKAFSRSDLIVALGGGVVSDLAGFAAATYMRGIAFIVIPTSLLGMVDASIGGKNAVNLNESKNIIGTFWNPMQVIVDERFLTTLPVGEMLNGFSEIIKIAAMADSDLFSLLENGNIFPLHSGTVAGLLEIITTSCKLKSVIVSKDPFDEQGRMLLNFGHTFGHAIEKESSYIISHGKAVAIGMIIAAKVGEMLNVTPHEAVCRLELLLTRSGLVTHGEVKLAPLFDYIVLDKKNNGSGLSLVLMEKIGKGMTFPITIQYLKRQFENDTLEL